MRAALRILAMAGVVLLFLGGVADAKVGWSDWLTAKTYHTDHFRVLYQASRPSAFRAGIQEGQTSEAYAKAVGDYIEEARTKIFDELGFAEPSWLEGHKVDVYITDIPVSERMGFKPTGVAYQNMGFLGELVGERVLYNPWIEIGLERHVWGNSADEAWKEHYLKALVAHEFFHVVQFGYDVAERFWLMESTATWVEDKAFDPPPEYWLSTGWAERYGAWDANRLSMSTLSSEDANEYAASVFFQYLSERNPGSNDIVRRIWEEAAEVDGHNTYQALAIALGDEYAWGEKMRARIGDFAVATLIQSPSLNPTFSFRKRDDVKQAYIDGMHPDIAASNELELIRTALDKLEGTRLVPLKRDLMPFQIGYYEIEPARSALAGFYDIKEEQNLSRLSVAVRGASHPYWDFRLVEVPRRGYDDDGPIEQWKVHDFPGQRFREKWASVEIEDFPRTRLFLVAVNTNPVERDDEIGPNEAIKALAANSFELAAAILTPPVVTSFIVDVDEAIGFPPDWRPVWKVVREPSSRPGTWRTRTILTEGIRFDKEENKKVRFRVKTSRPVDQLAALDVGGEEINLKATLRSKTYRSDGKIFYNEFEGFVDYEFEEFVDNEFERFDDDVYFFEEAAKRLAGGEEVVELEVAVSGFDSWIGRFDEKPETAPRLSVEDGGTLRVTMWEGGASIGGNDRLSGRKLPIHKLDPTAHLVKLAVLQNGEAIYRATWRPDPDRDGARKLVVTVNEGYDPDAAAKVYLSFAEPVVDVTVRLASGKQPGYPEGYRAELPTRVEQGSYDYTVTIPPSDAVAKILAEDKELAFLVDARVKDGPRIDADPRSAAWYDWDDKRWYGLEENVRYGGKTDGGGTDEWHKLDAAGRSIVLLLDASGSMEDAGRMVEAKDGIAEAVRKLRVTDEAALIVFFDCNRIQTVVPFTNDHEEIVNVLHGIEPSGDTPLGDAIRFANNYLQTVAQFPKRKLLVFSDGETTCGSSATGAVAEIEPDEPKRQPDKEDKPKELRWTAYRVGTGGGSSVPNYWVEAIEYRESDHEDDANDQATLTVRRHPVSYVKSRGRTVWSINWSRSRDQNKQEARGPKVPGLRGEAGELRERTITKDRVHDAVQRLMGLDAVALGSAQ
ncbi:MAG: VWA domain-containing protein [Alphaproteobacteria bacterium]|nr:VWA domain-containing protein [Alphaproteobacteria bacterium]